MRKIINPVINAMLCMMLCLSCSKSGVEADYNVIPLPNSIEPMSGAAFKLSATTKIVYPADNAKLKKSAELLSEYIMQSTGINVVSTSDSISTDAIVLAIDTVDSNKEAYLFEVNKDRISIKGSSAAGVFYGAQTLRKSLPISDTLKIESVQFNPVKILDAPRFAYRGAMLDVARHFQPVDVVKKYIDVLALHNINKFHWHLTDDQGWRIEIKKYPLLTEVGSTRPETVVGRNSAVTDKKPHGGFYTQAQIRDIVAYAADRSITIIPEIDLPGHMLAALTPYPELGCTGGPYTVGTSWGVYDDVLCAGNEKTFAFLEDVYSEIVDLFPSKYIHIGGDECPKVRWKACPKCQAKIKELGLKADAKHTAEERLQSYVISRMETFLNSKGRKIIGWDEILEGGLAPNATVMSWRSVDGGIQAAKEGHDAIMSPTSHMYFDYYQSANIDEEPLAIGGLSTLENVYSFNPIPSDLSEKAQKHIIGVQANLWTEYIATPEQLEYMLLPRLAALAEVQWTQPEKKNYKDFLVRLFKFSRLYDVLGLNYSKRMLDLNADLTFETDKISIKLSTVDNAPIFYTLDGSEPTEQSTPFKDDIIIDKTSTLKAVVIRGGKASGVYTDSFDFNKATLKPITVSVEPQQRYAFGGAKMLVDGKRGGGSYSDGSWVGYNGSDVEAVIDLLEETDISSVEVNTFVAIGDWVFGATRFNIAVSNDNKEFKEVFNKDYPVLEAGHRAGKIALTAEFASIKARYVKVLVGVTTMPEWHAGKGGKSYLFLDEFVVK